MRKTERYRDGIFGNDEFDTLVCGYQVAQKRSPSDQYETAFLAIVDFVDVRFKTTLEELITAGHIGNIKKGGLILFGLGCLQEKQFVHDDPLARNYVDEPTLQKLMNSSSSTPITVMFSFEKRQKGYECECCGLADKIRAL